MRSTIRSALAGAAKKIVSFRSNLITGVGLVITSGSVATRWPWIGGALFGVVIVVIGISIDEDGA